MSKEIEYYESLNTLRAVAVLLVIIYHWVPSRLAFTLDIGGWGVNVFFVLSGFLITKILLQNKDQREITQQSIKNTILTFYIRRAFRIFPIYYLSLIIIYVFSSKTNTTLESSAVYYFTYTTNIYYCVNQHWDGMLSHLWSLAVEEQFYIFWPWIIIVIPKRILPTIFISIASLSIIMKQLAYCFIDNPFVLFQTPTCLDAFCLGAILAYVIVNKQTIYETFKKKLLIASLICGGLYASMVTGTIPTLLPKNTLMSVISLSIIAASLNPNKIFLKTILGNKIMIFLGKISYGLYLYHNFIPWIRSNIFDFCCFHFKNRYIGLLFAKHNIAVDFFLNLTVLIVIAVVSWYVIERPLIKQKDRFNY